MQFREGSAEVLIELMQALVAGCVRVDGGQPMGRRLQR